MRLKHIKGSEENVSLSKVVIKNPEQYKGKWKSVFNNKNKIYLEIGMGKGSFLIEHARRNKNVNYIGFEKYPSVLLNALETIENENLTNIKIICADAYKVDEIFYKEISKLYLNFSDPWPKKRHIKRRLTSDVFLKKYNSIFKGLKVIEQKDVLTRKNTIGHFTVSCWVLNQSHDKVLMCYHKIYNSWCWLGGHVDGQKDFKKVALKEFQEESGLKHVQFLKDDPFSIEVLTVNGHIKNGVYVSSHLHYNITYLMEANDQEKLIIKEDENKGLQWFDFEEALKASTEPWLVENVYKKLNKKIEKGYH